MNFASRISATDTDDVFASPTQGKDQQLIVADLTNFLDVLLILVIFFIVSTTINYPLLPLQLPISESATITPNKYGQQTLHLSIAGNDVYRLQDTNYSLSKLNTKLATLYAENPERVVIVYADQTTLFGDFMKVVDLTKSVGFRRIEHCQQKEISI